MYTGELYFFQIEGAKFLTDKRKAICAYKMGLGKTHVAMAATEKLREHRGIEKVLVICPNYLKWKWEFEIEDWTDQTSVVIDGDRKKREKLYESLDSDYVILNYELLLQDYEKLLEYDWDIIIADEITRIKNYRSKTKKIMKKFNPPYRWGLTGTPISNRPDEIYSIMDWVYPSLYGKWWSFEKQYIKRGAFNQIERYVNLNKLSNVTSNRMITKLQEEVADELPDVVEENMIVNPTNKQYLVYNEIASSLEGNLDMLVEELVMLGTETDITKAMIRQRFSALRQAAVCPKILDYSESDYVLSIAGEFDNGGKIPALFELIDDNLGTEKMVIFSFFIHVLPIIEKELQKRNIKYCKVQGGMPGEEIVNQVKEFQSNPEKLVFLTTDAGEKGIDLQCSKYLVNMDIPFSWEKYDQRLGRIKRIGSTHNKVNIFNFIMKDSFEERQFDILRAKRDLSKSISGKSDKDFIIPTDVSLRQFLKEHK